ncbi:hypothetical protein HDU88_003505 [Geranomyces variabilis]|nr:hypothetical protein HDU88_003505 [Geranomyces variabilis]
MDYIPGAHSAAQFLGLEERASVHSNGSHRSHGSHHLITPLHTKSDKNNDGDSNPGLLSRAANVVTATASEAVTSAVSGMMGVGGGGATTSILHHDHDKHHHSHSRRGSDVGVAGKMANLASAVAKEKIVKAALHSGSHDDDDDSRHGHHLFHHDHDKHDKNDDHHLLATVTGGLLGTASHEHHKHRKDKDDDHTGILGTAADAASTALATVTGGLLGSAAEEHHEKFHHSHHRHHSHSDDDDNSRGILSTAANAASTAVTTATGGLLMLNSGLGRSHSHNKHEKHKVSPRHEERGRGRLAVDTVAGTLLRKKKRHGKDSDSSRESSGSDHHRGIVGKTKDILGDAMGGFIGTVAADEAESHHEKKHGESHNSHHKRGVIETVTGGILGTVMADEVEDHHKKDHHHHHGDHNHDRHRGIIGKAKDVLGDAAGGLVGTVAAEKAEAHHDRKHGDSQERHHKRGVIETVTGGLLGTAAADHHHKDHNHHHHKRGLIEKMTGGLLGIAAGDEYEKHHHKNDAAREASTASAAHGSTSATATGSPDAAAQVNSDGSIEEPRRGSAISLFRKNTARRFKSLSHLPGSSSRRGNNNEAAQPTDQTQGNAAPEVAGDSPHPPQPTTPTTTTGWSSFSRGIKGKLGRRWRSDSITPAQAAEVGAGGVLLGGWNGQPGAAADAPTTTSPVSAPSAATAAQIANAGVAAPATLVPVLEPGRDQPAVAVQAQTSAPALAVVEPLDTEIGAESHAPKFGSWRRLFGSAGAGAAAGRHDQHVDGNGNPQAPPAGWSPALVAPAAVVATVGGGKPAVVSPIPAAPDAAVAHPPAGWAVRPTASASGHDWRDPGDTAVSFGSPLTSPAIQPVPPTAVAAAPTQSTASANPQNANVSSVSFADSTDDPTTIHALTHQLQTLEFHLQQEQHAHQATQHQLAQYQRTVSAQSQTLAQIQAANSGLATQLASIRAAQQHTAEQAAQDHAAMVASDAERVMRDRIAEQEKTALRVRCEAAERRVRDLQRELHEVEEKGDAAAYHHPAAAATADAAVVTAQAARISDLVARVAELELAVQRRDEMAATSVLKIQTSQRRMEYLWDMFGGGGGANYQGGPQQQQQQYHQQQRQPLRMIQPWDRVPAAAEGWTGSTSNLSPRRVSGPAGPQIFEVDGMGRTMASLYASR